MPLHSHDQRDQSRSPIVSRAQTRSSPGKPTAANDEPRPIRRFFMLLGPGLITGASDDDPSGIATYAVAGASFLFATLWTALVTGVGLAGVLRRHYSRTLLYPAVLGLVIANTINAGAGIGTIAAGINLLVPIPVSVMAVMYFIIVATAATLFESGKTNVQSAAGAALALRPLAGNSASALLALGLVGAGFLAVPVLTGSAAYAVSEAFGWRYGLDEKPVRAKHFYGIIAASTLVGMLINFAGINPIDAPFWSAVINGFLAPPLLILIMLVTNNRVIMSNRVNSPWTNLFAGAATVAMSAAAIGLILTWGGPR